MTVRQFTSGQGFVRVAGGREPRWNKDGSELYFLTVSNQGFDMTLMLDLNVHLHADVVRILV